MTRGRACVGSVGGVAWCVASCAMSWWRRVWQSVGRDGGGRAALLGLPLFLELLRPLGCGLRDEGDRKRV